MPDRMRERREWLMPYCYPLAQHGRSTLSTRPFAKELRADVISQADGHKLVELDFSGVLSASHSFADEFVAQLAEDSRAGAVSFGVVLTGAGPDVEAVVSRALERRDVRLSQLV
jgi:hypothetical protein